MEFALPGGIEASRRKRNLANSVCFLFVFYFKLYVTKLELTKFDSKPEDVSLVEFMYLVFTQIPCESYRRSLGSLLLCLC